MRRKNYIGSYWNNNGIFSTVYSYGYVSNTHDTFVREIKMNVHKRENRRDFAYVCMTEEMFMYYAKIYFLHKMYCPK